MFAAWGRVAYRHRWTMLLVSGVLLAVSLVGLFKGGVLSTGGPLRSNLESARAQDLVHSELATDKQAGSTFLLIFQSGQEKVADPAFESALKAAVAPLAADSRVTGLVSPYTARSPQQAQALTSRDGHEALVQVDLRSSGLQAQKDYVALRNLVKPGALSLTATGQAPINRAFNTTLESDLQRAEVVSLPLSLALLLIIFGSVVAAGLPLGVGILTIVGGIGGTLLLAHLTDVSQYALNVVTLIGLAVSIDYSLFVVNRFRDELAAGGDREAALAATIATAGRAITFSGLTVAIGLSGMLFFQGTFLASMGAAGAISVGLAVLYALTFLPAVLALAGGGVDRWRVPILRPREHGTGFWKLLATAVMRRPVLVLVPTAAGLAIASLPFFHLRMANGDVDMLPRHLEARQAYDRLLADFPGQDETSFSVVVHYPSGSPLTAARVGAGYDLDRRIAALPGVLRTQSIYDLDPRLTRADYQALWAPGGRAPTLPPGALQLKTATVGPHIVLIQAFTNAPATSDKARAIVRAIRADRGVGGGGQVLVGGQTAVDLDVVRFITERAPVAVAFVLAVTYVVLFLLTGSVVLPLKAVVLNLLSIGASFGALVWIFQDGHLQHLLAFTPQSIDPSIPVILFCVVFGMSMDYEVLLVSRIHEEYVRTGDNRLSVAEGLQRSGRLITGAAAIMVGVFLAFGLAEVVIIKAVGLGLAIAVALDATIVRALVVPAVMRLLGHLNWWAPNPLRRLHERAGLAEFTAAPGSPSPAAPSP